MVPVLPPTTLLAATAVVAMASSLQAVTGMGMALVAVPLLALIDPVFVPGPTLCAVLALSIAVAWRERVAIDHRLLTTALLGLVGGCAIGAAVLALLIGPHLIRVFAVLILGAVLMSVSGVRVPAGRLALLIGGTASGIFGTMAGTHGPPIALVLQHEPPERLRATLCAFFAAGCALSLMALGISGLLHRAEIGLGIELLPGVAIGFALAPGITRHINRRRGRAAVLAISTLSAFVLLLH